MGKRTDLFLGPDLAPENKSVPFSGLFRVGLENKSARIYFFIMNLVKDEL